MQVLAITNILVGLGVNYFCVGQTGQDPAALFQSVRSPRFIKLLSHNLTPSREVLLRPLQDP
jgi:hypothetical protein